MTSQQQAVEAIRVMATATSTPAEIGAATQWLEQFEKTQEAWVVFDQLLYSGDASASLFASTALHRKMQNDFHQLPADAHGRFRDSLLTHCKTFNTSGPLTVLQKLCQSMADLILQMDSWLGPINDLMANFGQEVETIPMLLEVLTALADECDSYNVHLLPERRKAMYSMLEENSGVVMNYLVASLQNGCQTANIPLQKKTMGCLNAWLRSNSVQAFALASTPLLTAPFDALGIPELFDVAKDVICELLRSSGQESAQNEQNAAVVGILVPRCLQLASAYEKVCVGQEDDENKQMYARGLCFIFSELGESYLPALLALGDEELKFVNLMSHCADNVDSDIARRTFYFWHVLRKGVQDEAIDVQRHKCALLDPAYTRVAIASIKHLNCSEDFDELSEVEAEDLRHLRNDVADALGDCCHVLGGDECLVKIFQVLVAEAQKPTPTWQGIEACLYGIRRIGRYVSAREEQVLPQLFSLLGRLPDHHMLSYTAILCVGGYADWVAKHPQYLADLVKFVTARLNDPKVCGAACLSIRNLCDACRHKMVDSMDHLVALFDAVVATPTSSTRDQTEVLQGICYVVSELPAGQLLGSMQALIEKPAKPLLALLSQPSPDGGAAGKLLQLISTVFQHTDIRPEGWNAQSNPHPCVVLMNTLWPHLDALFNKFAASEAVVEEICRCVKHAIKSSREHSRAFLTVVVPKLVHSFQAHPFCSYLDVASSIVNKLCGEADLQPSLAEMLLQLSMRACAKLNTSEAFTEDPDLVDDYFELLKRVMSKAPALLLQPSCTAHLPAMTQCCALGIGIAHRDASRAVLSFLEAFLELGLPSSGSLAPQFNPMIVQLLGQYGAALIHELMKTLADGMFMSKQTRIGSIFSKMFTLVPQSADLVGTVLKQYTFLPDAEKEKVYNAMKQAAVLSGDEQTARLCQIVSDYAHVCRVALRQAGK